MKLFTEEQVIQMLELTNLNVRFYIDTMIPIELPMDDEIFNESIKIMEEWYGSNCKEEIDAHFRGAKWVIDKIKNQQQ